MVRTFVVVDLASGKTLSRPAVRRYFDHRVPGSMPFRPFGVSWSPEEIYVASHRHILVYDRALDLLGSRPVKLPANTHQLLFNRGVLWAVSPWTNSIIGVSRDDRAVEVDLLGQTIGDYRERAGDESADVCHFNSALCSDQRLYVAAHAFGPKSFIVCLDSKTYELANVFNQVGSSIHCLAQDDDLYWLSTDTQEIRSLRSFRLKLRRQGYARGLGMTASAFVVGISERLARGDRHIGHSWIQLIDRASGNLLTEVQLSDVGSINDLRIMDEYDFAHGNPPIWAGGDDLLRATHSARTGLAEECSS